MKKLFATLLMALCFTGVQAQVSLPGVGPKPTPVTPSYDMPAGKIYIDISKIPKPRPAHKEARIKESCTGTDCNTGSNGINQYTVPAGNFNSGSFRVVCGLSHVAFDDPLVWPGQAGKTHGHQFFGNTGTKFSSDVANMAATGDSTCVGGTLNRTGYWAPFFVYECPPATAAARGCNAARNGEPIFGTSMNFYYKNSPAISSNTTVWPPVGLRMIAGNATATGPDTVGAYVFQCYANNGFTYNFNRLPLAADGAPYGGCYVIDMIIGFQQCWNGVNLDSPNHQSHVAHRPYYQTCAQAYPTTFPITMPGISLNVKFKVANQADLAFWRLSSDPPYTSGQPAGYTAHADWVDGWNRDQLNGWGINLPDAIMLWCGSKGLAGNNTHRDCHNHLIGNINPAKPTTTYTLY